MKIQKKNNWGGVGGGSVGLGWGGGGVDVNGEVNFCENSKKKNFEGGGWVGVRGGGSGGRGGVGLEGVSEDVNGEVNFCENSKKKF